jgi:hypothetical protein
MRHFLYIYSNMQTINLEPTQRLNVDLPQSQYFALKSYALHANKTVSQLVRESLQQVVDYDAWFRSRVEAARAEAADPDQPKYTSDDWQTIRNAKLAKAKKLASTAPAKSSPRKTKASA